MALTIYGIAQSRAFRTIWMAHELGIEYTLKPVHYKDVLKDAPSFADVNPNLRIPAIDDDGFVLWESMAINNYLAKKHAEQGLWPCDMQGEARVMQWALWAIGEVEPWNNQWGFHAMMYPAGERDPAKIAEALEKLDRPLKVLDAHLAQRAFVLGDSRFTVADINVAGCLYRGLWMPMDAYPNVKRWLQKTWTRPAALAARKLRES
jgi:glutathione S-transferase